MNAMETEDQAYVAWMDEQPGAQEATERRLYEAWAQARREDGLPSSEEDYGDYLEAYADQRDCHAGDYLIQ